MALSGTQTLKGNQKGLKQKGGKRGVLIEIHRGNKGRKGRSEERKMENGTGVLDVRHRDEASMRVGES